MCTDLTEETMCMMRSKESSNDVSKDRMRHTARSKESRREQGQNETHCTHNKTPTQTRHT